MNFVNFSLRQKGKDMAKKLMLGIEGHSKSGITQGIGYSITFKKNTHDQGFQSPGFEDWRKQVTEIILHHRDDVFDVAKGEGNARSMASEIIAASKANGFVVADDGEVPAIQVSGIDPQNKKKGKKLDISFSAKDNAPVSIVSADYTVRHAQEINHDGTGDVGLPATRTFGFIERVIAL
jgi:hypothetical protein